MWNSNSEVLTTSAVTTQSNIMSQCQYLGRLEYYYPVIPPIPYDYLVFIDFEATCYDTKNTESPKPIRDEMPEIIQFPAIMVTAWNMEEVGRFSSYVRPIEDPVLSPFCTRLTGITQAMVKKAPTFPEVLRRFEAWLRTYHISLNSQDRGSKTFAIVTDGSYDMGHFLYKQCLISKIPYPSYATRWINLKTVFSTFTRRGTTCLKGMLDHYGLKFEGQPHNGLDDAKNIYNVLCCLMFYDGAGYSYENEKIVLKTEDQQKIAARILSDNLARKYDLATVETVSHKEPSYYPGVVYPYPPKSYDFANESMTVMNTVDYCSPQQQSTPTGSCESISSGCSNKENSIPMYIPSKGATGIKSRASGGSKDATSGSSGTPTGTSSGSGSGRHAGKRKKRILQLKDPNSNGSGGTGGCLNGGGKVGSADLITSDVSRHSHLHLDSDGSIPSHLQPLVSDLPTEE